MEAFLSHLAWIGPPAVIVLATVLRLIRTRLLKSGTAASTPGKAAGVAQDASDYGEEPYPFFDDHALSVIPSPPPPAPPISSSPERIPGESYEDFVKRRKLLAREKLDLALARQEGMARAVEELRPTLVTIQQDGTATIEDFPQNDPRRVKLGNSEYVEVDLRDLLADDRIEQAFLPRHMREKLDVLVRLRREARLPDAVSATNEKIKDFENHRRGLRDRAQAAFDEALQEIKVDAEKRARNWLTIYRASNLAEAQHRGVDISAIESEYVSQVVDQAVQEARKLYDEGLLFHVGSLNRALAKKPDLLIW